MLLTSKEKFLKCKLVSSLRAVNTQRASPQQSILIPTMKGGDSMYIVDNGYAFVVFECGKAISPEFVTREEAEEWILD